MTTDPVQGSRHPGARNWLAVSALSLGAFILIATEFLPVGILPLVARDLHISLGVAGAMILVPGLAAGASATLTTVAFSRLPRNRLIIILMIALILSNVLAAISPTFAILLLARVLSGAALGAFWAIGPALGQRLVSERHANRAAALVIAGVSVGTVIGLPAGELLGNLFGWRSVFASAAAFAAVVLAIQIFSLPRIATAARPSFGELLAVFRNPPARAGLIIAIPLTIGQFAASTFIAPFLQERVHLDSAVVTVLFLAYGVAGIAGTVLAGALVSRSTLGTVVIATAAIGIAILMMGVTTGSLLGTAIVFVLWGLAWGMIPVALQTFMMSTTPAAPESAAAVLVTVFQFAIALGSLVGGVIVNGGGVAADYWIAGSLVAAAAVIALIVLLRAIGRMIQDFVLQ